MSHRTEPKRVIPTAVSQYCKAIAWPINGDRIISMKGYTGFKSMINFLGPVNCETLNMIGEQNMTTVVRYGNRNRMSRKRADIMLTKLPHVHIFMKISGRAIKILQCGIANFWQMASMISNTMRLCANTIKFLVVDSSV